MCTECAVEDHDLHGVKKLEGIIEAEKEELEALIMKVGGGNFVLIFSTHLSNKQKLIQLNCRSSRRIMNSPA